MGPGLDLERERPVLLQHALAGGKQVRARLRTLRPGGGRAQPSRPAAADEDEAGGGPPGVEEGGAAPLDAPM